MIDLFIDECYIQQTSLDRITASYSYHIEMIPFKLIYLRFALRENKQAEEESRLRRQPQRVHQSSWQDGRVRGQLTVRC